MMGLVGVKFDKGGKVYYFNDCGLRLKRNLTVITQFNRGLKFGTVCELDVKLDNNDVNDYERVIRIATKRDYLQHLANIKDAKMAIGKCKELIQKNGLNMSIIDSAYNFDRSQLVFRFTADERVDFRKLARELGACFRTRIELRQIGIRDKAKEVGGLGPCGRKLCCSNFLKEFDSVSINMAKNQSLSLNPAKINGVCGRLLCCLNYENDNYTEYKNGLPAVGSIMPDGKVMSVDIFKRKYKVMKNDKTIEEVDVGDEG